MKHQWNLGALRKHIREKEDSSEALLEIVHSIDRHLQIFLYHMEKARDAMDGIIDLDEPTGRENFKLVLGASERQDEYYLAKLASEAHILGAVHSTRAVYDVFAFLVNALVLDGRIPERKSDIKVVTQELPVSPLKTELEALLDSYWFGYITDFVNTAKHRVLVSHSFKIHLDEPAAGIQIGGFQEYPAYSVKQFLEGVLEVKNCIVDCGQQLNKQVGAGGV